MVVVAVSAVSAATHEIKRNEREPRLVQRTDTSEQKKERRDGKVTALVVEEPSHSAAASVSMRGSCGASCCLCPSVPLHA